MSPINPIKPSPVSWLPRAVAAPNPTSLPSWLAPQAVPRAPARSSTFPTQHPTRGPEPGTTAAAHANVRDALRPELTHAEQPPEEVSAADVAAMDAADDALRAENDALHEEAAVLRDESDALRTECETLRAENAALRERVGALSSSLTTTRSAVLEASEPELVQLALAIAERVVGRELSTSPALVAEWAREALACLSSRENATVTVSSDVAATVPTEAWSAVGVTSSVAVDSSWPAGSCVARSGASSADASLGARLSAVRDALDGGEQ